MKNVGHFCVNSMWKILDRSIIFVLAFTLIAFGFPGQSVGICALTDKIIFSTELSRDIFSVIYACATMTGCFLVLFSGKLIDRFGLWRSTSFILVVWTLLLILVGRGDSFYAAIFSHFCTKKFYFVIFLYLSLSLLRFLGQNMLPVVGRMHIVVNFDKKSGLVMSFIGAFVSLLTGLAPRVMHFLSGNDTWYMVYERLAMASVILTVGYMSFVIIHKKCFSRKVVIKSSNNDVLDISNERVLTRKELMKKSIFWCIMFPLCLNSFIGSGTTVHIVDIFRSAGESGKIAINSYLYLSAVTVIASFMFGNLADKGRIKESMIIMLFCQFFGLIGLEHANKLCGFLAYVVCIGASWGGYAIFMAVAWIKFFSKANLGLVFGVAQFLSSVVGSLGVILMSRSKTMFESYFVLFHAIEFIIIGAICFVVCRMKTDLHSAKNF